MPPVTPEGVDIDRSGAAFRRSRGRRRPRWHRLPRCAARLPALALAALALAALAAAPATAQETLAPGAGVDRETRLDELEEQIRRLTDRAERAEFAVRRIAETLGVSVRDLEERVAALEAAGAPPAPAAEVAEAAPEPAPAAVPEPPATAQDTAPAEPPADTTDATDTAGAAAPADPPQPPAVPDVAAAADDPRAAYDNAYEMLKRADYAGAEAALTAFLNTYPTHRLAGNASYWLGETHYARQEFERAAIAFARGYRAFPDGAKAPDNLLKLGMAFYALGKAEDACLTFAKLRDDHPGAPAMLRDRMTRESERAGCR